MIFTILGWEDEEAANVGADDSDDVDYQPRYEEVRLVLVYSRYGEDVTEEKNRETEDLIDCGDNIMPDFFWSRFVQFCDDLRLRKPKKFEVWILFV